ncbi:trigger factor [Pokkaliibacter plantistimulans]|uniref:Trigger factor n=1 Tax=Proteobacteria bacterium 228 TaxID=2083153 RepID=A0A2S5KID7_9PROT|nr:trigger factor [Pokkaliibacter plantistimulans]PPC74126.1 trigger factor [Pokkaliibacter plantistimulans]
MQVSIEATSTLERRLTITIPAARIEADVEKQLKDAAKNVRVDGFRKGKVPSKIVKQRYGKGIRQDVLSDIIRTSFYEAVTQEKLNPAGTPSIEPKSDVEGQDFEFVATFEVFPEIALADFSAAEIEKQSAEVADADVDTMIETLRKQQASWNDVERASQDGDRVTMDFEGFVDGEAFDGGKAEGYELVLGSNTMIPGFETGLLGAKAGDDVELNVAFPEEYHAENLKGKPAVFKVKVTAVAEPVLPELSAEFFSKFGVEEQSEEGFRAEIRKNMERELKNALRNKTKTLVLDALCRLNPIAIPAALISDEVDTLRRQAVQQFGGDVEKFDLNMLPAELFKDQAEQRVRNGLLLAEVIRVNEIKADEARVGAFVEEMSAAYQQPEEVKAYFLNDKQQRRQIEAVIVEDVAVETLLAAAKVNEVSVSYEEAIKPAASKNADA